MQTSNKKQTFISLLRGINVSGKRILKMETLSRLYSEMGLKNIKTYIQSGNVIFQTSNQKTIDLEKQISENILNQFKIEVPIIVLNFKELQTIFTQNPFLNERNEDISKLHLTLLSELPTQEKLNQLTDIQFFPSEYHIYKKSIYLFCPEGYSKTKLTNTFFENKLKIKATTRNWKTMNEIWTLAKNIDSTS